VNKGNLVRDKGRKRKTLQAVELPASIEEKERHHLHQGKRTCENLEGPGGKAAPCSRKRREMTTLTR